MSWWCRDQERARRALAMKLFMDVSAGGCIGRFAGCRYGRSRAVVGKMLEKM
jgi:hypothetical protein